MKTYPVWRRLLSWRERFMKRSISANIHTKYQRPVLGRISALFLCKIASVSFFFISSSFKVLASNLPGPIIKDSTPTDVPTPISHVQPVKVNLGDEATMKASDTSLTSPRYVDQGGQIETLSQVIDLFSPRPEVLEQSPMCEGTLRQIIKKQRQAWNAHYFLHFPTTAFAEV